MSLIEGAVSVSNIKAVFGKNLWAIRKRQGSFRKGLFVHLRLWGTVPTSAKAAITSKIRELTSRGLFSPASGLMMADYTEQFCA